MDQQKMTDHNNAVPAQSNPKQLPSVHTVSQEATKRKMEEREALLSKLEANNRVSRPMWLGLIFIACLFALVPYAAHKTKIQGAVIASGQLKTVETKAFLQHEIGGIIRDVFISPGDVVSQGQTLITLDTTTDQADLRDFNIQLEAEENSLYRLNTLISTPANEWKNLPKNSLSDELISASLASMQNATAKDEAEIRSLTDKISSLEVSLTSLGKQQINLENQLNTQKDLYEREIVKLSNVEEADMRALDNTIEQENVRRQIVDAKARKDTLENAITQRDYDFRQKLLEQKIEATDRFQRLNQAIRKTKYQLSRKTITAPVDGMLTNLIDLTEGMVLPANVQIAQIIPTEQNISADLMVRDTEIDYIQKGQRANISLGVNSDISKEKFDGVVEVVSRDRISSENLNNFYQIIVRLDPEQFQGMNLPNGVPVIGYLATQPETLLSNILNPITKILDDVFKGKN